MRFGLNGSALIALLVLPALLLACPDSTPGTTTPDAITSADTPTPDTTGDAAIPDSVPTPDTAPTPDVPAADTPGPDTPVADTTPSDKWTCISSPAVLTITPSIETADYVFGATETDPTEVRIRPAGGDWAAAHPTSFVRGRASGVLFHLTAATDYELQITTFGGAVCDMFTTLPEDPPHTTANTVTVSAGQSIAAAVAGATPGTDIVVQAGIYRESVDVAVSGAPGQYVRIMGQPGAILDGSLENQPTWTDEGANVWSTPWTGDPSYLARNGVRMYHYTSLSGLQTGLGDDDVPIDEGWFVDSGTLYVRSATTLGVDDTFQLPQHASAFALDGVSNIWIEGFEIRFYGDSAYPKGIDIRDSDHVVVRGNSIHDTSSPIWARKGADHVRIEGNTIYQSGVDQWEWAAKKGTDHENTAINIAGGIGFVVRDNVIHTIFNGIGTGSFDDDDNPQIAHSADIYRNRMRRIGDDGLEPEGACVNNRFWDNSVDQVHNGISLAPITWGPVFVLRNRFTDYSQSGFKVSNDSVGPVFLYHNTSWTDRADNNGMNVSGPFTNMTFRNNIIRGTRYAVEITFTQPPGNDLDYDNWFTTRGAPWVKWDDVKYDSLTEWCAATGLECGGHQEPPALIDPATGAFGLQPASPNVDAGIVIDGINTSYDGDGPDIGYRELGEGEPPVIP